MTLLWESLYRYTPGDVGNCETLCLSSTRGSMNNTTGNCRGERACHAPTARYTTSVTRYLLLLLIVSFGATAQQQAPVVQEPPEEDVTVDPKTEYVLNPLQAE